MTHLTYSVHTRSNILGTFSPPPTQLQNMLDPPPGIPVSFSLLEYGDVGLLPEGKFTNYKRDHDDSHNEVFFVK